MKVLTANINQYNILNNYTKGNNKLIFEKDANGKFIVGIEVLQDNNFIEIKEQLQSLPLIDYNPKIVNIL